MKRINISNLHTAGCKLFQDLESFLEEIEETKIEDIVGGTLNLNLRNITLRSHPTITQIGLRNGGSVVSNISNSVHNNTINGQTRTNFNTIL